MNAHNIKLDTYFAPVCICGICMYLYNSVDVWVRLAET